jgi:ASC-1-like (ASCH) protein
VASKPRIKTLWIRLEYLAPILEGRKTVEVRVGYKNIARLRTGDMLRLNDAHLTRIVRVGHYRDFEALLAREDPATIAPDTPGEELLGALRALYPPEKEALGAVALEIEPVADPQRGKAAA